MTHASDARHWLISWMISLRVAPRSGRLEPLRRARAYLQGLLALLQREDR